MATTGVLLSLVAAMKDAASGAATADQVVPVHSAVPVIARVPLAVNDRQAPPTRAVRVVNNVEDLIGAIADKATVVQSEGLRRLPRPCPTSKSRLRRTTKAWIRSRARLK